MEASPSLRASATWAPGLDLKEGEWKQILGQLDRDDKGYVRYEEFITWLEKLRDKEKGGKDGGEEAKGAKDKEEEEKSAQSYEGTRKKKDLKPVEACEVTIDAVRFTDRALAKELKGADIFVGYQFLEESDHVSRKEELEGTEVELDFTKTFPVPLRSTPFEALVEMMTASKRAGKSVMTFTVYSKEKGHR